MSCSSLSRSGSSPRCLPWSSCSPSCRGSRHQAVQDPRVARRSWSPNHSRSEVTSRRGKRRSTRCAVTIWLCVHQDTDTMSAGPSGAFSRRALRPWRRTVRPAAARGCEGCRVVLTVGARSWRPLTGHWPSPVVSRRRGPCPPARHAWRMGRVGGPCATRRRLPAEVHADAIFGRHGSPTRSPVAAAVMCAERPRSRSRGILAGSAGFRRFGPCYTPASSIERGHAREAGGQRSRFQGASAVPRGGRATRRRRSAEWSAARRGRRISKRRPLMSGASSDAGHRDRRAAMG